MFDIRTSVEMVKTKRHGVPFRLVTNGLFKPSVVDELKAAGLNKASVALVSSDPKQYEQLMRPTGGFGHSDVCQFVLALAEAGIETECTMVKVPGVNVNDTKRLSDALGAVEFRVRDYFP